MTLLSKRAEALKAGATFYFTGKSCPAGHICKRFAINGACHQCHLVHKRRVSKRYRLRHREKLKEKDRKYEVENASKISERKRLKRLTERDEQNRKRREKYAANIELGRARSRRYRATRRAKEINAAGNHTEQDIVRIRKLQKNKCANCRERLTEVAHVDHIMPLALGGSNNANNLQLLCKKCNLQKAAKHPFVFAREQGMLF